MIEGLLGKKLGMTRIFIDGLDVPVTVIKAGECYVTQRKIAERDGYDAVQIGFEEKKASRTTKPMQGHFKKAGTSPFYHLKEFRGEDLSGYKPGQKITVKDVFKVGDRVDVTGRSKGKGFAGVMKRWNFSGGPAAHGSMHNRAPGSIGQSAYPSKVFKGMKMPGHYGAKRVTVQNLEVVAMREDENIIMVRGAVPGSVNTVYTIKKAIKKR